MSQLYALEEFVARTTISRVENFKPEAGPKVAMANSNSKSDDYETGYKAGWSDASVAEALDQSRISAEFARNLQDIGFTFHEARCRVLKSLENLLTELVGKIIPEIASKTIGLRIIEEVVPMAEAILDRPTQIVVSPSMRLALEPLLTESTGFPLELIEEPSLCDGQVFLRCGGAEKRIDFTKLIDGVSASLSSMYEANDRMISHG